MQSQRLLIVEDDDALRGALARWAEGQGWEPDPVGSLAQAMEALDRSPRAVLVDYLLPDGTALTLAEAARARRPAPAVVAMSGQASAEQAFRLALSGTAGYLAKPFTLDDIGDALRAALEQPPSFDAHLALQVGKVPLTTVQKEVRTIMLEQAMALAESNRSRAGRLLGISRQAVQQMLRPTRTP